MLLLTAICCYILNSFLENYFLRKYKSLSYISSLCVISTCSPLYCLNLATLSCMLLIIDYFLEFGRIRLVPVLVYRHLRGLYVLSPNWNLTFFRVAVYLASYWQVPSSCNDSLSELQVCSMN